MGLAAWVKPPRQVLLIFGVVTVASAAGFSRLERRFDGVDERFGWIDGRFNRLEQLIKERL